MVSYIKGNSRKPYYKSLNKTMAKYKVLVEGVELDGVTQEVGAEVELTDEIAAPMVEEGKLEAVKEDVGE